MKACPSPAFAERHSSAFVKDGFISGGVVAQR